MNLAIDEKQKIVYFVRHGQSIDNTLPIYQSDSSPLSRKGIIQAKSIADRLSHVQFDVLWSSPLRRAKETAEYIAAKTAKQPIYSELLVEAMKPIEIDGKEWIDKDAAKAWKEWQKALYNSGFSFSNGESYDEIIARTDKTLAWLNKRPEPSIVVVTHGFFLRAIIARVLLGDKLTGPIMKRFQELASMENTGITVLQYRTAFEEDYEWRLWTYNDHSHFAE